MYSLHRLDPMKHLFYPSSTAAREAAAAQDAKNKKRKNNPSIMERLPRPATSFHPHSRFTSMDSFSLLGRDGVVFNDHSFKKAALYDTVQGIFTLIPPMNSRKRYQSSSGVSLPVIPASMPGVTLAENEDDRSSLYVMDMSCNASIDTCFEVLACHDGSWRWSALPGPPFLAGGGPPSFRGPIINRCSYAAIDDGSTICVSSMGIGTYAFNTASHVWRQVGQWALPLYGRAEYAPELKLWLGISDYCNPSPRPMLCALDLSAMDNAQGLPMPQRAWDYLDLRHDYNDNRKTVIGSIWLTWALACSVSPRKL
jgi:hypothetical protein